MEENNMSSIQLSKKFKAWIETQGSKGESYEKIIKRLANYKDDDLNAEKTRA